MNTRDQSREQEIESAEASAEAARNRIEGELQALGDKLTPEHIKEEIKTDAKEAVVQAKDVALEKVSEVKESVTDVGRSTLQFAERNPIPLALIGAGIGWLLASRSRGGRLYRRGPGVYSGETRERAIVPRVEEMMHEGAEKTRHLRSQARDRMTRWGRGSRSYARESPLALGALSLATGIGVGLALPATRREEELFRSARERWGGQARGTAEQVKQTVKETAREIKDKLAEPLTH